MIKSKLRILPGSVLPYASAVLFLLAAACLLIDCRVTMELYRLAHIAQPDFPALALGELLKMAALVLFAGVACFAVKKQLLFVIVPSVLFVAGGIVSEVGKLESIVSLGSSVLLLWIVVITATGLVRTKWPWLLLSVAGLACIAVLCVLGEFPYVTLDERMGQCLQLNRVLCDGLYYLANLVLAAALSKQYQMNLPEELSEPEEDLTAEQRTETLANGASAGQKAEAFANGASAGQKTEAFANGATASQKTEAVANGATASQKTEAVANGASAGQTAENAAEPLQENGSSTEKVVTEPIAGSRLQKILKEEIVLDRDQKLVYKRKINVFSVIGLVLSVLTAVLGTLMVLSLIPHPVFQNADLGLVMCALGLFMICLFGTRLTYKEYFTKTIVTERKVVREESNWEEVLANRLEEDEKNLLLLTDNYQKMAELYGRLLENTAGIMNSVHKLETTSRLQQMKTPELSMGEISGMEMVEDEDKKREALLKRIDAMYHGPKQLTQSDEGTGR